jgi:hypothetical protein
MDERQAHDPPRREVSICGSPEEKDAAYEGAEEQQGRQATAHSRREAPIRIAVHHFRLNHKHEPAQGERVERRIKPANRLEHTANRSRRGAAITPA